ncbi:hypothetical protein AAF712_011683 [Marasmius tenuissimus]|uniref:Protein kinase domain-containing protein n=1 Tax=Marasmius tenuissimus TaxID=585030 RepID=A0ABR2ZJQ0_9AGAR
MPPSRHESTIRSNRRVIASPIKYRAPFEDDEPIVRHRPASPLTEEQRRTLEQVSRVFDGLEFGLQFFDNYDGLGQPEYSQPLDPILKPEDPRPRPLDLKDFECLKSLGDGESCKVVLARTARETHALDRPGTLVAVKAMTKKWMREYDPGTIWADKDKERSVLTELPWSPFVCGLMGTFVDSRNVYLALEFMPSGSLRELIREHAPLPVPAVQFFTCGIIAGLAFLHDHEIMHRDVKPENVLIGPGGYPVLVDFGCARRVEEDYTKEDGSKPVLRDWQRPGTILYTPPEMTNVDPDDDDRPIFFFGPSMDWWGMGCIVYEMVTRRMAFYGSTIESCLERIDRCTFSWPPAEEVRIGKTLKAFINSLLQPHPQNRLGTFGVQQVMDHPWLGNIDWAKIVSRQYVCPMDIPDKYITRTWHSRALPKQTQMPGLRVKKAALYLQHDKRFRPKASQKVVD